MSILAHKQLSLADIYSDCSELLENDKPKFLSLLEENLNLDELIPYSFYSSYYSTTGRPRKYHLSSMLWALILQRIFSIPTDSLLLIFLNFSSELKEFCGFTGVPNTSQITRFKQEFLSELQDFSISSLI